MPHRALREPHHRSASAIWGPGGTFTEQALLSESALAGHAHVALPSIPEVLEATAAGDVDLGFAAIENSIEGSVNVTLDTLAFESDLLIQRETVLSVQLNLLAPPGAELAGIQRVVSFPHAVAQCRSFLRANLPGVTLEAATSTAEAVRSVAAGGDPRAAAIGGRPRRAVVSAHHPRDRHRRPPGEPDEIRHRRRVGASRRRPATTSRPSSPSSATTGRARC